MNKEYQPWEYCTSIDCRALLVPIKAREALHCRYCEAYKMHDFLLKQGYKIVKEGEKVLMPTCRDCDKYPCGMVASKAWGCPEFRWIKKEVAND